MITDVKSLDVARHNEESFKKDTVLNTNSSIEITERKCREVLRRRKRSRFIKTRNGYNSTC